jgi:hypothetical protein
MTTARRSRKRAGPKPSARVSLRQLAKKLGVTEGAVRKRHRAGGFSKAAITRGANGRPRVVDPELAVREWAANRAKPAPTPPEAPQPPQPSEPTAGLRPGTLTEAQIRVAFQREVKLELENLQRRGVLIDAAIERRRDFECARVVRDSVLNIPDRVSAQLAAETEAAAVHRILTDEIRAALVALAEALDAADADASADGGADAA